MLAAGGTGLPVSRCCLLGLHWTDACPVQPQGGPATGCMLCPGCRQQPPGVELVTRMLGRALASPMGAQPHPALASHPGPPEEGPRVVFMVDLWHPNVAAAERQALDFIFAPGR